MSSIVIVSDTEGNTVASVANSESYHKLVANNANVEDQEKTHAGTVQRVRSLWASDSDDETPQRIGGSRQSRKSSEQDPTALAVPLKSGAAEPQQDDVPALSTMRSGRPTIS